MIEVNLHAPVDLAQQVIPGMRERGGGWILSISSDTARQFDVPYRDTPEAAHVVAPYGATKAALNRYMEGLAHELSSDSIFVNTLAPVVEMRQWSIGQPTNQFSCPKSCYRNPCGKYQQSC